ncbi:MAG TPA: HNH endonuclease, partial [Ktedonobacteraceae bacterium]
MTVPLREQRLLGQRSGDRCAFPTCRRRLTAEASPPDQAVILGEIAHIIAESSDGPRGDASLSLADLNKYENLILLCNVHHQLIDDQYQTFTIERLRQMKQDHEAWVESTLGRGIDDPFRTETVPHLHETVYSTL